MAMDESAFQSDSPIKDFYKNKNVFITGVTGFIGKVLLEKLLRSCEGIGTIYVLMRKKKGQTVNQRLNSLLNSRPFTFNLNESHIRKVIPIEGDITHVNLSLTEDNQLILRNNVDIVFHVAASVRFDASLRENFIQNVYGTQSILQLCHDMTQLKCFIHVSTAYANCHLSKIEERLEPMKVDLNEIDSIVKLTNEMELSDLPPSLIEDRPNTYTYTKAIAEHIVNRDKRNIAIAIVRPSIVSPAMDEPAPGWIDNVNGPAGLGLLAGLGILRTVNWDGSAKVDIIPVDVVVNAMIAISWHTATNMSKELNVYNCTISNVNPITWSQVFDHCRVQAVTAPSTRLVRPIIFPPKNRVNSISFYFIKIFSHILFAYFVDAIIMCLGYKRILLRITQKMHHAFDILRPFTTREWTFKSDNLKMVHNKLTPHDKENFNFDISKIDWHITCRNAYMGCRRYLLNEDDSTIPKALKRMKMIEIGYKIFLLLLMMLLWFVITSLSPIGSIVKYLLFNVYATIVESVSNSHAPLKYVNYI